MVGNTEVGSPVASLNFSTDGLLVTRSRLVKRLSALGWSTTSMDNSSDHSATMESANSAPRVGRCTKTHWQRSARTGSTRVARSAGMKDADSATIVNRTVTPANVGKSVALTP